MKRLLLFLCFLLLASPAWSAITLVSGSPVNCHTVNGGNCTITLPTLAQNDVVYVFGGFSRTGVTPGVSTSGYTTLTTSENGTLTFLYIGRKVMGATPDTTVVCLGSGNSQDATGYVAYGFTGVDTGTPEDATTTVNNTAAISTNPDPPSITTATDNAWVLAIGLTGANDATVTAPTNYGNQGDITDNDTRPITAMGATRTIASHGAEDPAAFTNVTSNTWVSASVAIRPSGGGGGGGSPKRLTLLGIGD